MGSDVTVGADVNTCLESLCFSFYLSVSSRSHLLLEYVDLRHHADIVFHDQGFQD